MTEILFPALLLLITGGVAARLWLRRLREQRIAERRRLEAPNSHYSSEGVREQEDQERWRGIDLLGLHPLNREEVARLLEILDVDGAGMLSMRERVFLDNMTLPRRGT